MVAGLRGRRYNFCGETFATRALGEAKERRVKESIRKSIMPARQVLRRETLEGGRKQADTEKAVSLCIGWNFKYCVGERGIIPKVLLLWLIKSENFRYFGIQLRIVYVYLSFLLNF